MSKYYIMETKTDRGGVGLKGGLFWKGGILCSDMKFLYKKDKNIYNAFQNYFFEI